MNHPESITIIHPCTNPKCKEPTHNLEVPWDLIVGLSQKTVDHVRKLGDSVGKEFGPEEAVQAICAMVIAIHHASTILAQAYPFLNDPADTFKTTMQPEVEKAIAGVLASFKEASAAKRSQMH